MKSVVTVLRVSRENFLALIAAILLSCAWWTDMTQDPEIGWIRNLNHRCNMLSDLADVQ